LPSRRVEIQDAQSGGSALTIVGSLPSPFGHTNIVDQTILLNCAFIFGARVLDVTLGTWRVVAIVHGAKPWAWFLGFFEILVWVWVVAQVIPTVRDTPLYAFAYAGGYATGGYVGMAIEQTLAIGERVILMFTRRGEDVANRLRDRGFVVTQWQANGLEGPINLLFAEVPRRSVKEVIRHAKGVDPQCFFVVEDVEPMPGAQALLPGLAWRARARKSK
jgi:uncharacterized protein YebE (UPF0316 family)